MAGGRSQVAGGKGSTKGQFNGPHAWATGRDRRTKTVWCIAIALYCACIVCVTYGAIQACEPCKHTDGAVPVLLTTQRAHGRCCTSTTYYPASTRTVLCQYYLLPSEHTNSATYYPASIRTVLHKHYLLPCWQARALAMHLLSGTQRPRRLQWASPPWAPHAASSPCRKGCRWRC